METAPTRKNDWVQIVAMILIVIAIGAAIGLGSAGIYQLATGVPIYSISSSTTGGSTVNVSIPNGVGNSQGLNYVPASVTVAKGGSVIWKEEDWASSLPRAIVLSGDGHCSVHPGVVGARVLISA